MTEPTTKKTVEQEIREMENAIEEYDKAYRSLKKAIGWLPDYTQYAIKNQIEEQADAEFEVNKRFDDQPLFIEYGPWKEP